MTLFAAFRSKKSRPPEGGPIETGVSTRTGVTPGVTPGVPRIQSKSKLHFRGERWKAPGHRRLPGRIKNSKMIGFVMNSDIDIVKFALVTSLGLEAIFLSVSGCG